jgi:hypothetical protein
MTRRSKSIYIVPARSPRVRAVLCFSSVFNVCLAHRAETIFLLKCPLNPFTPIGGLQYPLASSSRPSTFSH